MIHKLRPLLIILVIVAIIGGGYWYFTQNPEQLTELKLRLGLITEAEASGVYSVSGFIEADEVSVAAETGGRITRIAAEEGDYVEAGQPLVLLDTALLEAEVRQAEAKIATAKAQLAKIEAGVRAEEIAQAEAAVAVAEANAAAASTQWQDAITLRNNPQELDRQIDAAKTALELAELRIEYAIPLKDVGEAMWDLRQQQWDWMQDDHRFCKNFPDPVGKRCFTLSPEEGQKQDAGVAWNFAGADMWAAWVDLNSAFTARDDAETSLNDLQRLRNDPQEAEVKVAQAEAAYQAALAEVAVAEAQLESLKGLPRREQVAVGEAQVQQAEASLAALRVQLDKHILNTPISGWVVERVAHEGEMAVPGSSLLTLADLTNVTLTVYVPEPDIGSVSVGQSVNVFVDAFPGQPFPGVITFISDKAEFTPKNVQTKEERMNTVFAVKIKLENQEQLLKPGMPADAVLSESPKL
jgi:multidrug efflux pump subunit AcrA (membrane-fusion protein)